MKIFRQTGGNVTLKFQGIISRRRSTYKKSLTTILVRKHGTAPGWVTPSMSTGMWTRAWSWCRPGAAEAASSSRATSWGVLGCSGSNFPRTRSTLCWHSDRRGKDVNVTTFSLTFPFSHPFQTFPTQLPGTIWHLQHRHWGENQAAAGPGWADQGSGRWRARRPPSSSPRPGPASAAPRAGHVGTQGGQCRLCVRGQHLLQRHSREPGHHGEHLRKTRGGVQRGGRLGLRGQC